MVDIETNAIVIFTPSHAERQRSENKERALRLEFVGVSVHGTKCLLFNVVGVTGESFDWTPGLLRLTERDMNRIVIEEPTQKP